MHQSSIMQEAQTRRHPVQPAKDFIQRKSRRIFLQHFIQAFASDILHDDPVIFVGILPHVKDCHQIRVLQIQTLGHTTQFDFHVVVQQLQRDLFTGVGQRIVHFTKSTAMNCAFDGVSFQRPGFWCECKLHNGIPTKTGTIG